MNHKTLILNSQFAGKQPLDRVFLALAREGHEFFLLTERNKGEGKKKETCTAAGGRLVGSAYFGPKIGRQSQALAFIFLLPGLRLMAFFRLWAHKKKGIRTLICAHFNEKLIFSPAAAWLKLNLVWLEFPNANYRPINRLLRRCYLRQARKAKAVAFNHHTAIRLRGLGIGEENIAIIPLGIESKAAQYQDNIFNSLVRADRPDYNRRYFTIGTIMDLDDPQRIETIFAAIVKSLEVAPNLQLIIVGEGKEKKNLAWMAKRMKIDQLVWFVGEERHLRKWLDSFDIFIVSAALPKLYDFFNAAGAMAAGLPVIGPLGLGLEEMIDDDCGRLIEMEDSEQLARNIIGLYQDKGGRQRMGRQARDIARERFDIEKTAEAFGGILAQEKVIK